MNFHAPVSVLVVLLLFGLSSVSANHTQTDEGRTVIFDHKTGNEWWVEVVLSGPDAATVDQVWAQDSGGPWLDLEKKSWGAWAASFHIEPGHDVRFRAIWSDNSDVLSCWFTHPAGVEQCTRDSDRPATYQGVSGGEEASAVAIGPDVVVLAGRSSPAFHVEVASLSRDLTQEHWRILYGGGSPDEAMDVAIAGDGSIYVVGVTRSEGFPTTTGAHDTVWNDRIHGEGFEGFVTKLSPDGEIVWSTFLGGNGYDHVAAVAVDAAGDIVVAGQTDACDFPTTAGAYMQTSGSCADMFAARFSPDGTLLQSTRFGGSDHERGFDMDLAPDGDVVLLGSTHSHDLPTTPGAYDGEKTHERGELFVARLDPSLSSLVAATYIGNDLFRPTGGIAADAQGVTLVTSTTSEDWPTTEGAWATELQSPTGCRDGPNTFHGPCSDAVVTKLQPALDGLVYSTYLGGSGSDDGLEVGAHSDGRVHVVGTTDGGFLPPANGQDTGFEDGFHALLSADGSTLIDASAIGGADWDQAFDVAIAGEDAYVTGRTSSNDFATSPDAADRSLDGNTDMFAVQVAAAGPTPASATFDHRGGNEWWVQVRVTDAMPSRVQAMDTGGPWEELTLRDWGDWAASFHIGSGHDVRFRAMVDGAWQESCWFTHPEGKTPDGGETCSAGGGTPPPSDFDATFSTPGGNEWWVEVYVDANEPLAGVDARDDGGSWISLDKKSWGAWARSFHVEDGSIIEFRARSTGGDADISGQYLWPEGTKVSDEPDGGGGEEPPSTLDVAFAPKAGNEWWVEAYVVANATIADVEARADGGPWHEMTLRDWGAWAVSFHAPDGSTVEFRVTGSGGDVDVSDGFRWPDAVPVDDPGGAWPQEGSYVRYATEDHSPGGSQIANATFVHHDGSWGLYCEGHTYFRSPPQPYMAFEERAPPVAPTDVTTGQRVQVEEGGCRPCCREQGLDVFVRGADTADTHHEGDPVTVQTWHGQRSFDTGEHEAEWEQETGLITDWSAVDTASGTGRLQDTDAPIR